MKGKRFLLVMLCISLLLSMVACAGQQAPSGQANPPGEAGQASPGAAAPPAANDTPAATGIRQFEGTTITIIAEEQDPSYALQGQLDKFTALTGIEVVFEMGPIDSVVQKEMLSLQAKNGEYDVISIPYQFLGSLVSNKYIMPLESLINDESLNVVEGFSWDDMIMGMTNASGEWKDGLYGVASNTCIMFYGYRKDLFENPDEQAAFKAKYGYDLAVPANWDQYRDISEFFTRTKGEALAGEALATDFYGTTICGKRHDAMTCEWLNYAWSFGGGIFDEAGNLIIDSAENVAALEYFNEMKQYSPPGVSNNTWDEMTTQFQQGLVAHAVMWNDAAPGLEDPAQSTVAGKMGYGAIPVGQGPAAHYGAWSFYIPANAPNPGAAWMFLQWFNTSETQKAVALAGGFPNVKSVFDDPDLLSLPYWEASLAAYEISSVRPRIPEWNEMNTEMMLELSKVISDEQTAEQALTALKSKYETLLSGQLPITYQ